MKSEKSRIEEILKNEQSDPASVISSFYEDSLKSNVKVGRRLPLDLWRWNLSMTTFILSESMFLISSNSIEAIFSFMNKFSYCRGLIRFWSACNYYCCDYCSWSRQRYWEDALKPTQFFWLRSNQGKALLF